MSDGSFPKPVRKKTLTPYARLLRLIGGVMDLRAWAHALKIVNYYNYSHVQPRRKIRMGPGAAISPTATFANPERIQIGGRVRLGAGCMLWAGPASGRVIIGDDVLFGPNVFVTAAGYRFNDGAPVTDQPMDEADVIIGNDVWLGTGAIILPGSTIGDGAIIGAGAVVRGSIESADIAVGIPARAIGARCIGKTMSE